MPLAFDKSLLVIVGIFLLDVWTPVGTPTWILYFIPLLFMRSAIHRHYPFIRAGLCSLFILAAFLLSPPDTTGSKTLTHRAVLIIAIWGTAIFMNRRNKKRK